MQAGFMTLLQKVIFDYEYGEEKGDKNEINIIEGTVKR